MRTVTELLKGRFAALGVIVVVILSGLLTALWSMQVLHGAAYAKDAEGNRIRNISLPASRGRILDAKGRPLVTNKPVMAVTAVPAIANEATLVARLSGVIDVPVPEIIDRLSSSKQERLAPRVLRMDVPIATVAFIKEHQLEFPGVDVSEAAVRQYPGGSLAAHVLGYTGVVTDDPATAGPGNTTAVDAKVGDIVGKTGVEAFYDQALFGVKGFRRYEVDNQGRVRKILAQGAPRAGTDIELTIDKDVQAVAEKALREALAEAHRQNFTKAHAGAAVVIDVQTGGIVAMASLPTYDPSTFLDRISKDQWDSLNATSSDFPLNNRAIMAAYPPASTFKGVTAAAALHDHIASAHSYFYCPGLWTGLGKLKSDAKYCWLHSGHGAEDLMSGIKNSCDSVFYEIGKRFYLAKGEQLQAFARTMGLGAKSGIDLPGEVSGRVPDAAWKAKVNQNYPEWQAWLGGDTVNMAIGQGDLLVTPLQLANAYATLGNGGRVLKPHVLKYVLGSDGKPTMDATVSVIATPGLSAADLATMRSALVSVTRSGTAASAFSGFPVDVAGKTGTAQVNKKDDYAVFACYAPAQKPRYAVAVFIEQGGHGGSVAAPAARQILAKLFGRRYTPVHAVDVSR
jgi:penicillin-binding protein 2